jgi:hypothetical protein
MDKIMLLNAPTEINNFSDLSQYISQDGADTVITFDQNVIRLTGVDHTALQASNFIIHHATLIT